MTISDLIFIGTIEIVYLNKKYIMQTYIAKTINGEPLELEDNYSFWLPISELIKAPKRLAITHLLDKDLIRYFESKEFSIIFTCDNNHNIINIETKKCEKE